MYSCVILITVALWGSILIPPIARCPGNALVITFFRSYEGFVCACVLWCHIRIDYMSSMAGALQEAGTAHPSRTSEFLPGFWKGLCCSSLQVTRLCCVFCLFCLIFCFCWQCFWIVHSSLPLWFSLTFIHQVLRSCVKCNTQFPQQVSIIHRIRRRY